VGLVNESLSVGPTRYRDVVLTSWDRRMSDCEQDPPALVCYWIGKRVVTTEAESKGADCCSRTMLLFVSQ
jgi:hypothetical protein